MKTTIIAMIIFTLPGLCFAERNPWTHSLFLKMICSPERTTTTPTESNIP